MFKINSKRNTVIMAIIILFTMIQLNGCGGKKAIHTTFAMTKITAEEIARAAKELNKSGIVSNKNLAKIKSAYEKARAANNMIIDALTISLDAGINPQHNENYLIALKTFDAALNNLLIIAESSGLILTINNGGK